VRLLASRAHSARELRVKLARRGHPAEEVGEALERLRAAGYLDDEAYARALIGRRSSSRGTRAMAAELAAKGVDRQVAQAALGEMEGTAEVAAAVDVARRMQRAGPTDLQRIGTRLLRRGFSMEVARAALRQL